MRRQTFPRRYHFVITPVAPPKYGSLMNSPIVFREFFAGSQPKVTVATHIRLESEVEFNLHVDYRQDKNTKICPPGREKKKRKGVASASSRKAQEPRTPLPQYNRGRRPTSSTTRRTAVVHEDRSPPSSAEPRAPADQQHDGYKCNGIPALASWGHR